MYSRFSALWVVSLAALSSLLSASSLSAQSPIGDPRPVSSENSLLRGFQRQTVLANGDVLVVWMESPTFAEPDPVTIQARRFGRLAAPSDVVTLKEGAIILDYVFAPAVAPRTDGGFLMTFGHVGDQVDPERSGCRAQAFNVGGVPLAPEASVTSTGACLEGLVAHADGTFSTVTFEVSGPIAHPREQHYFKHLSPLGEPLGRARGLIPARFQTGTSFGNLAGNASGDLTYIVDYFPTLARSFSALGGPLQPLTLVGFTATATPAVAVTPTGVRIFASFNGLPPDSNYPAYQVFSPDGTPLTRIRPAIPPRDALFGDPVIAADRFGNFVVAWASLPTIFDDPAEARLFRADGTPVGKSFFPGIVESAGFRPQVSFGDDGTFALTWVDEEDLKIAFFSASQADEPCLVRGGRLLCDTGRTGGETENDQPNAPSGAEPLFLADYDGDGRADPCFRTGSTFRCDLEHGGRGPRIRVRFGEPNDLPLMGNVDGDGRAEACVRRGDLLACDTAHNGGGAEFEERFGSPTGIPLLGDLNGDHRDDLCLFHDGVFACDVAHDGGEAEISIHFGQAGDLPALGDFDGDGRDDPCVLRGSTLLCDTKHDGGEPEASLTLAVQPGDGFLMGNLDGL